jgi:hypothetical protein
MDLYGLARDFPLLAQRRTDRPAERASAEAGGSKWPFGGFSIGEALLILIASITNSDYKTPNLPWN